MFEAGKIFIIFLKKELREDELNEYSTYFIKYSFDGTLQNFDKKSVEEIMKKLVDGWVQDFALI